MTSVEFHGVSVDARSPERLARFWAGVLGWETEADAHGRLALTSGGGSAYRITFHASDTPKTGQNRIHFDLTSTSHEAMRATIARALDLGGRRIDIGQSADDGHEVLADPEGNELCVIEPGNSFLADTGVIGAINCDGSQAVGHFWSRALEWPLVWDQDEETAIQSPRGGSKITWSGPPLMPRHGRDRLRLDLALPPGGDLDEAVARLLSLGAARAEGGEDPELGVVLIDPDGNEFRITTTPPA